MGLSTQTPTCAELPYEIWYCIVSFIPNSELESLPLVNRALFDISMSIKYRHISTSPPYKLNRKPEWYLISQNPKLGQHVLSLNLICMNRSAIVPRPTKLGMIYPRRILDLLMHFTKNVRRERKLRKGWQNFIESVDQLRDLRLLLVPHAPMSYLTDLLPAPGLRVIGSNLRNFTLVTTIESLDQILLPSIHLEGLEDFSLEIQSSRYSEDGSAFGNTRVIAPFVKKHSKTLEGLSLDSPSNRAQLPIPTILQDITFIPHLKRISISHACQVPEQYASAIYDILLPCRYHLSDVTFTFLGTDNVPGCKDWFNQEMYFMTLPNLRRLELKLWESPLVLRPTEKGLILYVSRHSCTLTELSIYGVIFTIEQLEHFLSALVPDRSSEISSSPLRVLAIEIHILAASVFSTLASRLPHLRDLHIGYCDIELDMSLNPPWLLFERNMRSLPSNIWGLGSTSFWSKYGATLPVGVVTGRVDRVVVESLPDAKFVNRVSREEFLLWYQHY